MRPSLAEPMARDDDANSPLVAQAAHDRRGVLLMLSPGRPSASVAATMAAPSEAVLRAAVAGEARAVEQVLLHLYPVVRRFLGYRFASLRGEVEDATQDIMVELVRSLPKYRFEGRLEAWALRLAFRTARRLRVRNASRGAATSDATLPENVFAVEPRDRGLALDVLRALDQISEKKRDAIILTEVLGLTAAEAAQVLGTFANTVQSRVRHAKLELGQLLASGDAPGRPAPIEGVSDALR